jgi:hypothetical protein
MEMARLILRKKIESSGQKGGENQMGFLESPSIM